MFYRDQRAPLLLLWVRGVLGLRVCLRLPQRLLQYQPLQILLQIQILRQQQKVFQRPSADSW